MAKKPTSKTKSGVTKIPHGQLDMPVTFDATGKMVTLREVLKPGHAMFASLASLSPEKRIDLTVSRLELQPDLEIGMIGGGLIDRKRAIEEVRAGTDIGRTFVEIEQIVVQNLLEEIPAS